LNWNWKNGRYFGEIEDNSNWLTGDKELINRGEYYTYEQDINNKELGIEERLF
jgi:hypothetical protein